MSPEWLDDELKKQRAAIEHTETEAQRASRLKLITKESAPGLMLLLTESVGRVVEGYERKASSLGLPTIEAIFPPGGGFRIERLSPPSTQIICEIEPVSGRFRCIRSTTDRSESKMPTEHVELTVDVDDDGNATFIMHSGRLTPDEVAEQLLKPVLFPPIA